MHRLFTVSAVIISAVLITNSADARPHFRSFDIRNGESAAGADKSMPKLLESAAKGKVFSASEPRKDITINMRAKARRLRTARTLSVEWKPGVVSTNVRIVRMRLQSPTRRMSESGEKGGTEDINIGVGELQECTISKSMDMASPLLAQLAKTRRRLRSLVLKGKDAQGRYFVIRMKHVFISSYQSSGSAGGAARTETATIHFTGLE